MADLLVSTLTGDGELEAALENAIIEETEVIRQSREESEQALPHENLMSDEAIQELQTKREESEREKEEWRHSGKGSGSPIPLIPLLSLVKQLLKTGSGVTLSRINGLPSSSFLSSPENPQTVHDMSSESSLLTMDRSSPSTYLLLKFQRLLFSRILSMQNKLRNATVLDGNHLDEEMEAAESVLWKYVSHLLSLVNETLALATQVGKASPRTYVSVASIISDDISGNQLPHPQL